MPVAVLFRDTGTIAKPLASQAPTPAAVAMQPTKESYHCDFYENIWDFPATDADNVSNVKRRRTNQRKGPLVDIVQVAYVMTNVLDYRAAYPPFPESVPNNIWRSRRSSMGSEDEDHDAGIPSSVSPMQSIKSCKWISTNAKPLKDGSKSKHVPVPANPNMNPIEEESETQEAIRSMVNLLSRSSSPQIMTLEDDVKVRSAHSQTPPSSNLQQLTMFSTIFSNIKPQEWSWSIRFLLGIHEPIRHALVVMDRFLEQCHQNPQVLTLEKHQSEFFVWFKSYFVEYVKSQHEVKVKVLHPLIAIKYSTKKEILRAYDDIYVTILQIQGHEPAKKNRGSFMDHNVLDTLQKDIKQLNMMLNKVLNLEETTLHSVLSESFDEETFQNVVLPRLFRAVKTKKLVVPWIVERSRVWGGDGEHETFQGMLPFSARFLFKRLWLPFFMTHVAEAMKNLNEFDLNDVQQDSFFNCTIQ